MADPFAFTGSSFARTRIRSHSLDDDTGSRRPLKLSFTPKPPAAPPKLSVPVEQPTPSSPSKPPSFFISRGVVTPDRPTLLSLSPRKAAGPLWAIPSWQPPSVQKPADRLKSIIASEPAASNAPAAPSKLHQHVNASNAPEALSADDSAGPGKKKLPPRRGATTAAAAAEPKAKTVSKTPAKAAHKPTHTTIETSPIKSPAKPAPQANGNIVVNRPPTVKCRVGDFVLVRAWWRDEEFAGNLPHVAQVITFEMLFNFIDFYLILYPRRLEPENCVTLQFYYRPHETFHPPKHRFYINEVLHSTTQATVSASEITSTCCVMPLSDYQRFKPNGFQNDRVFVCVASYSFKGKAISPYQMKGLAAVSCMPRAERIIPSMAYCDDNPIAEEALKSPIKSKQNTVEIQFVADTDIMHHIRNTIPISEQPAPAVMSKKPTFVKNLNPHSFVNNFNCHQIETIFRFLRTSMLAQETKEEESRVGVAKRRANTPSPTHDADQNDVVVISDSESEESLFVIQYNLVFISS